MNEPDFIQAHRHSMKNRAAILASETCGCFYCLSLFSPEDVEIWVDDIQGVGQTAICPECGIDSVIGAASGFEINTNFLGRMEAYWFGIRKEGVQAKV